MEDSGAPDVGVLVLPPGIEGLVLLLARSSGPTGVLLRRPASWRRRIVVRLFSISGPAQSSLYRYN